MRNGARMTLGTLSKKAKRTTHGGVMEETKNGMKTKVKDGTPPHNGQLNGRVMRRSGEEEKKPGLLEVGLKKRQGTRVRRSRKAKAKLGKVKEKARSTKVKKDGAAVPSTHFKEDLLGRTGKGRKGKDEYLINMR